MANIDDLKALNSTPRTVEAWMENFNEEEREVVQRAMITHAPSQLFPILKDLDVNPFPFSKSSLSAYSVRVKNAI